jgi:serine/threonine-protein kinase
MSCLNDNEVFELLQGTARAELRTRVQAHIDGCDACRVFLAEAAKTLAASRADRVVIRPEKKVPPAAVRDGQDLRAGAVVAGRYRLDEQLGQGGGGVVWAATDRDTHARRALKFLKATGPVDAKRFAREARVTAALVHPNIVRVYELLAVSDHVPVIVMELLSGEPLARRLAKAGAPKTPTDLWETLHILRSVVQAVEAAHAVGVVHRDLKPANVFLSKGDGGLVVKVLDFGFAKRISSTGGVESTAPLTRTGHAVGTPHYMAPEQVLADPAVDHRVDVWALGVMLYESLEGRRPFEARSLQQLLKLIARENPAPFEKTPDSLRPLVDKMLSRVVPSRPTIREIDAALMSAMQGLQTR